MMTLIAVEHMRCNWLPFPDTQSPPLPRWLQDRAAVNLWDTRLHRSSSMASQHSWPEPSRLPDVGEASQPDAWRWPAEVTPDRRVGTFPPGVHRWSDQAVASTSSSLHSSTRRTF